MRRLDGMGQLKEELVKHIDEAHAMEQNVLRMLDSMIATTDDPEILDALEHHKVQTQGHADRMAQRLEKEFDALLGVPRDELTAEPERVAAREAVEASGERFDGHITSQ